MRTNSQGSYVYVMDCWENPMADSRGRILLHRYVMAKHLGRPLLKEEIVHHIDGNKNNNCAENLAVFSNEEHVKLHKATGRSYISLICNYCGKEFYREKRNVHKGNCYCSRSCSCRKQQEILHRNNN